MKAPPPRPPPPSTPSVKPADEPHSFNIQNESHCLKQNNLDTTGVCSFILPPLTCFVAFLVSNLLKILAGKLNENRLFSCACVSSESTRFMEVRTRLTPLDRAKICMWWGLSRKVQRLKERCYEEATKWETAPCSPCFLFLQEPHTLQWRWLPNGLTGTPVKKEGPILCWTVTGTHPTELFPPIQVLVATVATGLGNSSWLIAAQLKYRGGAGL